MQRGRRRRRRRQRGKHKQAVRRLVSLSLGGWGTDGPREEEEITDKTLLNITLVRIRRQGLDIITLKEQNRVSRLLSDLVND